MKLFLTGGTGFVGSHFLKTALDRGHEVRALRRGMASRPKIDLPVEPEWIEGELAEARPAWFEGCETLLHLAAAGVSPQQVGWTEAHQVNVADSMRLVETANTAGVGRFVICGTCLEYGHGADGYEFIPPDAPLLPVGPYATSKAASFIAMRGLAASLKLRMVYLRPFNMYGEGQFEKNLWPSMRLAAQAGQDFAMTAGEQIRDYRPVGEGVDDLLRSLEIPLRAGEPLVVNLGSGAPKTLREYAEQWWREWDAPGRLLVGAMPYRPGEVMRYAPQITPWENLFSVTASS